jgi:hypothetical protein
MRLSSSKKIERFFKRLVDYTQLRKAAHYVRNSGRPNAVFIWIPKNAGTSMYHALRRYGCVKTKEAKRIKYQFSQRGLVTFGHMDYHELVKEGYVSEAFDRTAFKFCFSRNPYDRAVSTYVYLCKSEGFEQTFLEFWRGVSKNGPDPIGIHHVLGTSHCNPQVRWIENLEMDFIGRYESLAEDFGRLTKELGVPPHSMGHQNRSKRKSSARYYCPETKAIIEDLYAEDFEYFGYPLKSDSELLGDG